MEDEAAILEPLELQFLDLLLLSSFVTSSCPLEMARLESISSAVMQALGPSGPGLLSITGVPRVPALRQILLPLARKLAITGDKDRARVLKEHGLGSDVPLKNLDRSVSSFALQLKYKKGSAFELFSGGPGGTEENYNAKENSINHHDEFLHLGDTFKELGLCMVELGLRVAQMCDKAIGGTELERSILGSLTAKGRLIHYHSMLDNLLLKEVNKRTRGSTLNAEQVALFPSLPCPGMGPVEVRHSRTFSDLWQQWHYDYGIFTVLTAPLFMSYSSSGGVKECSSPDDHTYLQLFDSNKNKIFVVKSRPESFIVQVGEAATILSKGNLRSTLHSVGRPVEMKDLSRETFVVFLQPAWDKILYYSKDELDEASSRGASQLCYQEGADPSSVVVEPQEPHRLVQEIMSKVPPLSSRLRDGMTFAEFSRETTKQYYGGNGTQSSR